MRGVVPGLASAVPIAQRLPGVYQEDEFTQRFVESFDTSMAPILATLDGLAAYIDPWLAPVDFLDWVAGWVGIELDDAWTVGQRRSIVAGAALIHRRRGTADGIADAVCLSMMADVEVTDSGGVTWSATPGGEPPGEPDLWMNVRVAVSDPESVDTRRIETLIDSIKPAHVPHTLEVVAATVVSTEPEPLVQARAAEPDIGVAGPAPAESVVPVSVDPPPRPPDDPVAPSGEPE